jgi:hypothetical protein
MLTEEKLKQLPQPAQKFWRAAQEFVTKNQSEWIDIGANTEEFRSWARYFRTWLDFKPFAISQIEQNRLRVIVMPTQWPEWFDEAYSAADPEEIERRDALALQKPEWSAPKIDCPHGELTALHGRPLGRFEAGTKWSRFAGRRASVPAPWQAPSDVELRARYGREEREAREIGP